MNTKEYYYECYEKRYLIPTYIFYIFTLIAFLVGFYIPWSFGLIVVSLYFVASREGKREGYIDGFTEHQDLIESSIKNGNSVPEQMDQIIRHFKNERK